MPAAISPWTDARVEELRRRWDEGETCSQIGRAMDVTRNAVIGKVHRLGLAQRFDRLSSEARAERVREQKQRHLQRQRERRQAGGFMRTGRKVEEPIIETPAFLGSLNIPYSDLRSWNNYGANQCRFIAAEPPGPEYLACGNETLPGESWCGHCRDLVFNRGLNLSDEERERRSRNATRTFASAQVKSFGAPREAAA